MAARRSPARFTRSYKGPGTWAGVSVESTAVPAASSVLLATFIPGGVVETVRRIRMSVLYSSDQNTASETSLGAVGAAVVEATAVTVGVTALPDPITDIQDDIWVMFQGLHTRISFVTGGGLVEPAGMGVEIDSKAMRKLPPGKALVFIVANESASFGALIQCTIRVYATLTSG